MPMCVHEAKPTGGHRAEHRHLNLPGLVKASCGHSRAFSQALPLPIFRARQLHQLQTSCHPLRRLHTRCPNVRSTQAPRAWSEGRPLRVRTHNPRRNFSPSLECSRTPAESSGVAGRKSLL